MRVTAEGGPDGFGFRNYRVQVEPSDVGAASPEFRAYVERWGHVSGLTVADLPAFVREVRRIYAR